MTESVKLVTFINIVFVVLLMVAVSMSGFIGEMVYYLAFVAPITIGFYGAKELQTKREEQAGLAEAADTLLSFDKQRMLKTLPLIAPFVTVVFLVSALTSLLLSLFGVASAPIVEEGIVKMLLTHAVAPALFEEALFRYIPMKLLLPYSRRWCVIYSSVCFALIHCSFSQMPYAFVAGIAFMVVDVALGSVWPSVILHVANNSASVIASKYCHQPTDMLLFVGVLLALCALSLAFVLKDRESYKDMLSGSFDRGESFKVSYAPFALAVICCCIAAMNI